MQDTTIQETYLLPSLGKIYDYEIDPHITLRSMTTEEEMKRLSRSEYQYMNLAEILDDCGVTDCGMSSYDMCVGDFQYLIYKLRIVTYGEDYELISKCPYCGFENKGVINLEDLPVFEYDESIEELREFTLPKSGKRIKLRFQTPRMLDNIVDSVKSYKKKSNSSMDITMLYTIMNSIESVDGKNPDPIKLEEWIRKLPMADANTILAYSDRLNNSLGVDIKLQNTCDLCGLDFESALRTTSEFFRPSIKF